MPSAQQVTTITSDALALLTPRYQLDRPFTPFQLRPLFWWRTSQGLTVVPTNDVKAWVDNRGSVALASGGDPTQIPSDVTFASNNSIKFVGAGLVSISLNVSPDPTVLSIVVVGSDDTGAHAGTTVYTATLSGSVWTVTPSASSSPAGIRVVEALVVARSLTNDEKASLATYYQGLYGVGPV